MIRTKSRLLLVFILVLLVIGIGQGVWVYKQNQQIELLQRTEFGILNGNLNETINQIDRFVQTKDRAVLENLYVRMIFMERESTRAAELMNTDLIPMNPSSPSGLVDLITRHNISNEQAADYLKQVQQKLRAYQAEVGPYWEFEKNRMIYIELWRELYQLASEKHGEWKLP